MLLRILTIILSLAAIAVSAVGQTAYSESKSYKPRPPETDKKKRSDKNKKNSLDTLAPTPAAPTPVAATGEESVTIPFSVSDSSRGFVSGITKAEIAVFVDGIETPVVEFVQEKEPPTVMLVIDSSPSTQFGFEELRSRAWTLIQALPANARVAILEFDANMRVLSQATTVRGDLIAALSRTKMGDGTSLYSAVATLAQKALPQVPGRKVVVMFTDGVDTTSKLFTFASSLSEVEKQDVSFYSVYVDTRKDYGRKIGRGSSDDWIGIILGRNGSPMSGRPLGSSDAEYKKGLAYLDDLSVASGGRLLRSDKIEDETKSFVSELSSRYYVTIKVQKKGTGSREIRVRINRPGLTVRSRSSFHDQ